ncbi:helix-turn-helix domain-containing protein [Amycolatopsis sp. 195334CR]|nr:helix-turn-helix domain-containing protein [Amycolatopsis sp. 195334CR]
MSSTERPEVFGPRLRELRTGAGLSLTEFARRLYYSKGYVSRVETGVQPPSVEFARRCDAELDAGGTLAALVPIDEAQTPAPPEDDDDGIWTMTMTPDGRTTFALVRRRDVLLGGAAALATLGSRPPRSGLGDDQLAHHRSFLQSVRALGQVTPASQVLPIVVGQAQSLRGMARAGVARPQVGVLSARVAEFAGWMAQESGDNEAASWWIARAIRIARETGDRHTVAYAFVRRALLSMYQGDARTTVELAQQAQSQPGTPPRILGLAAQREAQGHALAGDYDRCMRALDLAARQLDVARGEVDDGPTIGTSHVPDPVAVVTGCCLYDLGRPGEAAEVLDRELPRIPATAVRARLRFGVRQALAHAAAGDLDRACALTTSMLDQVATIDSATVLTDVTKLAATFRRWHTHPGVRALDPVFGRVLYRGA